MDLNNIQTEKDLLLLKEKVKEIEKKIKESDKPKTITISGNAHNKIKKFCGALNLNIGEWTEKILLKEIEDNNCIIIIENFDSGKSYEDRIKEDSEILKDKYIKEKQKPKYLIKSNKLILSNQLKFNGYSRADGLPIYEFTGEDMTHFKMVNDFDKLGVTFEKIDTDFGFIKTNEKLEDYVILDGSKIEYEVTKYEKYPIPDNFFEPPVITFK